MAYVICANQAARDAYVYIDAIYQNGIREFATLAEAQAAAVEHTQFALADGVGGAEYWAEEDAE